MAMRASPVWKFRIWRSEWLMPSGNMQIAAPWESD